MPSTEQPTLADALWQARESAFAPGEFVGQESFVTASEIRDVARAAAVGPATSVLDVCCGTGGPGRLLVRELGCGYLGVDASPASIAMARTLAGATSLSAPAGRSAALGTRYRVCRVPPLPSGSWDVVVLLETLLAFRRKRSLLAAITSALPVGGRFACTVEAGSPLTSEERDAMPAADTVWPTELPQLVEELAQAGLEVRWQVETSRSHGGTAEALADAYAHASARRRTDDPEGAADLDDLVRSHRLWADWLTSGRMRTYSLVAERVETGRRAHPGRVTARPAAVPTNRPGRGASAP